MSGRAHFQVRWLISTLVAGLSLFSSQPSFAAFFRIDSGSGYEKTQMSKEYRDIIRQLDTETRSVEAELRQNRQRINQIRSGQLDRDAEFQGNCDTPCRPSAGGLCSLADLSKFQIDENEPGGICLKIYEADPNFDQVSTGCQLSASRCSKVKKDRETARLQTEIRELQRRVDELRAQKAQTRVDAQDSAGNCIDCGAGRVVGGLGIFGGIQANFDIVSGFGFDGRQANYRYYNLGGGGFLHDQFFVDPMHLGFIGYQNPVFSPEFMMMRSAMMMPQFHLNFGVGGFHPMMANPMFGGGAFLNMGMGNPMMMGGNFMGGGIYNPMMANPMMAGPMFGGGAFFNGGMYNPMMGSPGMMPMNQGAWMNPYQMNPYQMNPNAMINPQAYLQQQSQNLAVAQGAVMNDQLRMSSMMGGQYPMANPMMGSPMMGGQFPMGANPMVANPMMPGQYPMVGNNVIPYPNGMNINGTTGFMTW